MISRLIAAAVWFVTMGSVYAQPDSLWSRTYGGMTGDDCVKAGHTSDGGYFLVGTSASYGTDFSQDFWLVKTDDRGDSLWSRNYGGAYTDACRDGIHTTDGGYLLVGETWSFGSEWGDAWIIKVDVNGDSIWSRVFGSDSFDAFYAIQQTSDGGYILGGYSHAPDTGYPGLWIVKIDANGEHLWDALFGTNYEYCKAIYQTDDGGYVLGGTTSVRGSGGTDFWLIRADAEGGELWNRTFGGYADEICYSVRQTHDGGFIMAGSTNSFGSGGQNYWLVKTDSNGDSLWSRAYGLSGRESCNSVIQTADNGYVMIGYTWSIGAGDRDCWLIRTDTEGNVLWDKTFGGSDADFGVSVEQAEGGNYIVGGLTWSFGAGSTDYWLIKTGPDPIVDTDARDVALPNSISLSIFPNPFNPTATISFSLPYQAQTSLEVYNVLGQAVYSVDMGQLPAGNYHHLLDAASLPSGTYLTQLNAGEMQEVKKMAVVR